MAPRYDLEQAQAYLTKLRMRKGTEAPIEKALIQQARLEARPIKARGITAGTYRRFDGINAVDSILPADTRRRLIIVVALNAPVVVWPDPSVTTANMGFESGGAGLPLFIDEEKWGVFVTYPWFAFAVAQVDAYAVFEEHYLQ